MRMPASPGVEPVSAERLPRAGSARMQSGERSLRAQGSHRRDVARGRRLVNAARMPRQVVVAGNYSHDTIIGGDTMEWCPPTAMKGCPPTGEERSALGGSSAYASAVLRAAGVDFAVVANVGDDFRYADLVPPARVVPGARTTSFVDDYRTGRRIATLQAAAPPLRPEDLRESCTLGMAVAVDLPRLRHSCTILLTDGPLGCTVLSATGEHHVPPFPARQTDPTGAGDCFLAGFAVGLLRGFSPHRSALLGNWCGARCTESPGLPQLTALPEQL